MRKDLPTFGGLVIGTLISSGHTTRIGWVCTLYTHVDIKRMHHECNVCICKVYRLCIGTRRRKCVSPRLSTFNIAL